MLVRFIIGCVVLSFAFIIAIPALQISALFSQTQEKVYEIAETQTPIVTENEDNLAQELNAIDTAAGDSLGQYESNGNENYGDFFSPSLHQGFEDKIVTPEIIDIKTPTDL